MSEPSGSDERLRQTAEDMPGALVRHVLQADGNESVLFMGPGGAQIWGIEPGRLAQDPSLPWRCIDAEDRPRVREAMERSARTLSPWQCEWRITTPSGTHKWLRGAGHPERDARGDTVWSSLVFDVSREHLADEARRQTEQRLRVMNAAIESSINGIALSDLEGRLTYVNPAFCRLWGVEPAEALMRSATEFWRTDEEPARVIDTLRRQGHWSGEMEARRPDGTVFVGQVTASMVLDGEGRPICLFGSFIDITEIKKVQAELQAHQAELERRVAERTVELAAAKEAAELANFGKSAFLARMSHELRTPLNAVLGFSQLLRLDPAVRASATVSAQLGHIHAAGEHLLAMIDEVLDLARIESGGLRLSPEAVELGGLLAECLALVRPLAERHRVTMHAPAGAASRWVRGDRTRLRQVIVNLLSNAAKYNRVGGSVDISVDAGAAAQLCVAIRDTGHGLTPEQIASLFQPFNRLGAETSSIEGTGLGLVIARQLTEAMGGALDVRSEPGAGSVFTLTLPRAVAADRQAAAPPPAAGAPPSEAAQMLVLYVEDNPVNVELVRNTLQRLPEVRLEVAVDGPGGLDAARRLCPDLLLLDLDLPGLHGIEVLRRLRADPATAGVPCVAVSANAMEPDIERARQEGFADYLTKPFRIDRLIALIAAHRRPRAPPGGQS